MATRVITTTEYTDDLGGGKAEGAVTFAFDGSQYEIDLSKKNRTALEKALKPYIDSARKVRSARGRGNGRSSGPKRDLGAIREWARSNGIEVSDRGRVAQSVIDQYDAAR